ncbi:MAG: hypothetical protein JNK04_11730 [Myxococcales bacterium]|nr:hypothetical protein [Myxococcales bacterium]
MRVTFQRTGPRRYAVLLEPSGREPQSMDPAPGYDDDIPHDLVHYVVEAELGLTTGVFGRAAAGGGTFIAAQSGNARERSRLQRKQRRRERRLRDIDEAAGDEMATSERLAALADVAWRRRQGQEPDPLRSPPRAASGADAPRVDRVVARLDSLAPLWRALPVGGALAFVWPSLKPLRESD